MKDYIAKTIKDKNFISTVLVTIGLLANSFFSYLLQLFLARHFSIEDFGTYNALLSMFAILSVPITVFSVSLVKTVSELYSKQKFGKLGKLFWAVCVFLALAGAVIVSGLFLLRHPLANYMNIDQPLLYFYLGLYIAASLLSAGPQAFLQGFMMFKAFSFYTTSMGLIRLIVPAGIVYLGYKIGGVYVGLSLGMFFSFVLGALLLKDRLSDWEEVDLSPEYKKILTFTLPILLLNLCMIMLNNVDIILVKKYLDAVTAGYYAGVAILGKIILFGAGSITIVMFPQIAALVASGKRYMERFYFFLRILMIILVTAIISFSLLPDMVAKVFFGEQLLASAQYLPLYAVFISTYVLVNFIMMFLMAINRTKASLMLIPAVAAQFIAINLYHESVLSVIRINIFITLLILVSLGIYLYKITTDTAR